MDIGGVAERLGVRVRYVRRLVAERRIPYIKLGYLLRFDPAQIDEWLERSRVDEALPTTAAGGGGLGDGRRPSGRQCGVDALVDHGLVAVQGADIGGDQGLDAVAEAACHLAEWYGALNTPTPVP
jgi:excisionase family DNA binding protein